MSKQAINMPNFAVVSLHSSPLDQPGVGDGGGMNVYVRQLSSAIARLGSHVSVYTRAVSPNQPASQQVEPGLVVHNVPAGDLQPLAKEDLPELVSEFTENVIQRISLSSAEMPDVVHGNYWLSGLAAHQLKHHYGIPMLTTFHTLEKVKADGRSGPDDRVEGKIRIDAEDQVAACSDVVLASCDHEAADLERYLDVPPERLKVVGLGVEHALFAPGDKAMARRAVNLPDDGKIVLYVGRIQPLKGLLLATQAFETLLWDHPDAYFVIVGGPSGHLGKVELSRCIALATRKGFSDRIIFRDPEPHLRLASYYRGADVVVVPSRSESFGLVALEAMACGTAVVASKVGGLNSLVTPGKTGFLVEERSPWAFAEAMGSILGGKLSASKVERATVDFARAYSWRKAGGAVLDIVGALASRELTECL